MRFPTRRFGWAPLFVSLVFFHTCAFVRFVLFSTAMWWNIGSTFFGVLFLPCLWAWLCLGDQNFPTTNTFWVSIMHADSLTLHYSGSYLANIILTVMHPHHTELSIIIIISLFYFGKIIQKWNILCKKLGTATKSWPITSNIANK